MAEAAVDPAQALREKKDAAEAERKKLIENLDQD